MYFEVLLDTLRFFGGISRYFKVLLGTFKILIVFGGKGQPKIPKHGADDR